MRPDKEFELDQKFNIKSWPHQFTKSGKTEQIGVNKDFEAEEGKPMPVMSQEMYCVHCQASYWTIKAGPPVGPCPARNKQREMKRILGNG